MPLPPSLRAMAGPPTKTFEGRQAVEQGREERGQKKKTEGIWLATDYTDFAAGRKFESAKVGKV